MSTILTSSWFTQLPPDHLRVGISRGVPWRGLQPGFRMYRKLAPGDWLRAPDFTARYLHQLAQLDARQVLDELLARANGKVPCLVCFERVGSGAWCHRAMVAEWFERELGLQVAELGFEDQAHPLRPLPTLL